MLKRGKIHSLYKVQVGQEWILLRDQLAEIDRMHRARSAVATAQGNAPGRLAEPSLSSTVSNGFPNDHAIEIDQQNNKSATRKLGTATAEQEADVEYSPANGIATASFVLSLCFFIPILNGITQLLALIFAHLALSQMGPLHVGKSRDLATAALWITYVQVGFLASSMAWMAFMDVSNLSVGYFINHFHMVGIALTALVGSGLLMAAVRMISGHLLSFLDCFIGVLLPCAVGTLGTVIIQSLLLGNSPTGGKTLAAIGLLQVFLFVFQMVFWSRLIRLPGGGEFGLGRAALASLSYSIVFWFIGIFYGMLFAALVTNFF